MTAVWMDLDGRAEVIDLSAAASTGAAIGYGKVGADTGTARYTGLRDPRIRVPELPEAPRRDGFRSGVDSGGHA